MLGAFTSRRMHVILWQPAGMKVSPPAMAM
jgi:hypothetical protein